MTKCPYRQSRLNLWYTGSSIMHFAADYVMAMIPSAAESGTKDRRHVTYCSIINRRKSVQLRYAIKKVWYMI